MTENMHPSYAAFVAKANAWAQKLAAMDPSEYRALEAAVDRIRRDRNHPATGDARD